MKGLSERKKKKSLLDPAIPRQASDGDLGRGTKPPAPTFLCFPLDTSNDGSVNTKILKTPLGLARCICSKATSQPSFGLDESPRTQLYLGLRMLMFLFVAEPQGAISESISTVPVSMETVFPLRVPAPGMRNVCATSSLPLTRNPSFAR